MLKLELSIVAVLVIINGLSAILRLLSFRRIRHGNMLPALAICVFLSAFLNGTAYATAIVSVVLVSGVLFALIKIALFDQERAFRFR